MANLASDLNSDPGHRADGYTTEYSLYPTQEQSATLRRWFGHIRSLHNAASDFTPRDRVSMTGRLAGYVGHNTFLLELPVSALGAEILNILRDTNEPAGYISRKRDVQTLTLLSQDFELTERARVVVGGLGELDVDFNEGVPEPFPVSIQIIHDPLAQQPDTIRFYYQGASHRG